MTYLRGAALLTWTDTGQIGAGSVMDDGGGGGTLVYTWGSAIPCRIDALAGEEGIAGGRVSDRSTHLVQVDPDTEVSTANQFAISGRGTFEITAVNDATAQIVLEFEVVKVS